eukprot:3254925-Pyramimonas_sp.AAC.2
MKYNFGVHMDGCYLRVLAGATLFERPVAKPLFYSVRYEHAKQRVPKTAMASSLNIVVWLMTQHFEGSRGLSARPWQPCPNNCTALPHEVKAKVEGYILTCFQLVIRQLHLARWSALAAVHIALHRFIVNLPNTAQSFSTHLKYSQQSCGQLRQRSPQLYQQHERLVADSASAKCSPNTSLPPAIPFWPVLSQKASSLPSDCSPADV